MCIFGRPLFRLLPTLANDQKEWKAWQLRGEGTGSRQADVRETDRRLLQRQHRGSWCCGLEWSGKNGQRTYFGGRNWLVVGTVWIRCARTRRRLGG